MRLVSLENIKMGDILAKTLFTGDGRVLLSEGVPIMSSYISKLNRLGVEAVYIRDSRFDDIEPPEILSDKVRFEVMKRVSETCDAIQINSAKFNASLIKKSARDIVESVLRLENTVQSLVEMRTKDNWLITHSVQVALISVILGKALKLNLPQLEELAVGALLHDIGMAQLPADLLKKPSTEYNEEEIIIYKEHTKWGFEYLRKKAGISLLSAHVAFQHHELLNGGGFPRKLAGSDIHQYAKIVRVADFYDELIAGIHDVQPMEPHKVYEIIMGLAGIVLDFEIVEVFTTCVAAYPTGSTVRLSNGEVAVVIGQNEAATRPKVRALWDDQGDLDVTEYDLSKKLTLFITEVIL